jgi:hypothetical protein
MPKTRPSLSALPAVVLVLWESLVTKLLDAVLYMVGRCFSRRVSVKSRRLMAAKRHLLVHVRLPTHHVFDSSRFLLRIGTIYITF